MAVAIRSREYFVVNASWHSDIRYAANHTKIEVETLIEHASLIKKCLWAVYT